ncbi:MAG: hypothetical protein BMS9Abin20_1274 [Acidimicrobiia bacterium]|nr:MAG: hypothetical protein BMS9Abin20_1274 [Acidimicrobiia bacterium]
MTNLVLWILGQGRYVSRVSQAEARLGHATPPGASMGDTAIRYVRSSPRSAIDFSRISTLRILPVTVIGNSVTNRT